jgi:hypothetical protein
MHTPSAIAALAAAVVAVSIAGPVRGAGYGPKLGARHPEFTLPDINTGKPVSLSDFRGKKVLLIQFASW